MSRATLRAPGHVMLSQLAAEACHEENGFRPNGCSIVLARASCDGRNCAPQSDDTMSISEQQKNETSVNVSIAQ